MALMDPCPCGKYSYYDMSAAHYAYHGKIDEAFRIQMEELEALNRAEVERKKQAENPWGSALDM